MADNAVNEECGCDPCECDTDLTGSTAEEGYRVDPVVMARLFHEAYERLAPDFGYKTREDSAVPWHAVPEPNRSLMIATCREVAAALRARTSDGGQEPVAYEAHDLNRNLRWIVTPTEALVLRDYGIRLRPLVYARVPAPSAPKDDL
jgi:hypothetical protein